MSLGEGASPSWRRATDVTFGLPIGSKKAVAKRAPGFVSSFCLNARASTSGSRFLSAPRVNSERPAQKAT
jgi:hypothetical protein